MCSLKEPCRANTPMRMDVASVPGCSMAVVVAGRVGLSACEVVMLGGAEQWIISASGGPLCSQCGCLDSEKGITKMLPVGRTTWQCWGCNALSGAQ